MFYLYGFYIFTIFNNNLQQYLATYLLFLNVQKSLCINKDIIEFLLIYLLKFVKKTLFTYTFFWHNILECAITFCRRKCFIKKFKHNTRADYFWGNIMLQRVLRTERLLPKHSLITGEPVLRFFNFERK